jgi:hypothetical protein
MPSEIEKISDEDTREALSMFREDDEDVTIGRMPVGGSGDLSEFDFAARDEADMTDEQAEYLFAGDEPTAFQTPKEDAFPLFRAALRKYQASERPPRAMRVDTDDTYGDFISEAAAREIDRRLTALEAAFRKHEGDPFAHESDHMWAPVPSKHDVLGAAQAVSDLRRASTASEAVDAMPRVPLDLPDFAQDKVRCWRDGDCVVVSIRFSTVDGQPRTATMAARPRADADEAALWAMQSGVDPTTVLGALPHLSAVATGKKLVRDVAGCALKIRARDDVRGMGDLTIGAEPVMLVRASSQGSAPLAALMHLQQLAESGNSQAEREMQLMHAAAQTPTGQRVAAPVLEEASRRLETGRQLAAASKPSLFERIAGWF